MRTSERSVESKRCSKRSLRLFNGRIPSKKQKIILMALLKTVILNL